MKAKGSLLSYLFQPFRYFAGGWALLWGVVFLLALSVISYFAGAMMDGVLDMHFVDSDTYASFSPFLPSFFCIFLSCIFLSWAVAVAVFYLTARILSKSSVRLVDMAGTMALAKKPMILCALLGFIPAVHQLGTDMGATIQSMMEYLQSHIGIILFMSFVSLIFLIWTILLMYNAYSVSGNLKGAKGIVSFLIALFIAEVISKVLIVILF